MGREFPQPGNTIAFHLLIVVIIIIINLKINIAKIVSLFCLFVCSVVYIVSRWVFVNLILIEAIYIIMWSQIATILLINWTYFDRHLRMMSCAKIHLIFHTMFVVINNKLNAYFISDRWTDWGGRLENACYSKWGVSLCRRAGCKTVKALNGLQIANIGQCIYVFSGCEITTKRRNYFGNVFM